MEMLIMGLLLFLGLHSTRMFAPNWRRQMLELLGERGYKAVFSIGAMLGLALTVWGFSVARHTPQMLWTPPVGLRHGASPLTLAAFVLITAAYVPANHLKAWLGHPMLAGTALWALAHLLANGQVVHVLLFGSFFVWAVFDFALSRRRDRVAPPPATTPRPRATMAAIAAGSAAWLLFAGVLHARLIGLAPWA